MILKELGMKNWRLWI